MSKTAVEIPHNGVLLTSGMAKGHSSLPDIPASFAPLGPSILVIWLSLLANCQVSTCSSRLLLCSERSSGSYFLHRGKMRSIRLPTVATIMLCDTLLHYDTFCTILYSFWKLYSWEVCKTFGCKSAEITIC